MNRITSLTIATVIAGLVTPASAEPTAADATALIEARYKDIDQIIASGEPVEATREKIITLMERFVDYKELSRRTLKTHWQGLDKQRQAEFIALFKQLIQRSYARRFEPDKRLKTTFNGPAEVRHAKKTGKAMAKVQTSVSSGKITADVEYRTHVPHEAETWWVYDIIIDDVSLMRNYRNQFHKIITRDGLHPWAAGDLQLIGQFEEPFSVLYHFRIISIRARFRLHSSSVGILDRKSFRRVWYNSELRGRGVNHPFSSRTAQNS